MCIRDRLDAEYIFGGACASFRSSVFKQLGGFDTENKTEDIEMSMRIRAAGYKCNYAEDVILSLIHISEPTRPY